VNSKQHQIQLLARPPRKPPRGVISGPDIKGGEAVDHLGVVDPDPVGNLCPRPDPHAVGLSDASVSQEISICRLFVRPDAFFQSPAELGMVGLSDQVIDLMVEGRVEEESVMFEFRLVGTSTESEELLAFCECPDGYGPFLVSDWLWRSLTCLGVYG
jgi:hypothetical protein